MSRREEVWERKRQAFLARRGDGWWNWRGWGELTIKGGELSREMRSFCWLFKLFGMIMFYHQIWCWTNTVHILKWGITRVSLLVLHGSDTKETKYGIWLILYKLGWSWILICTWIKYYCTHKSNVLSISAFYRQAWKLFEYQRWVNYYCLTNNNKWRLNPWIDLDQWRNLRAVRIFTDPYE